MFYEALKNLRPNVSFYVKGASVTWLDDDVTPPTQDEIDVEIQRLEAEHIATQYQRDRQPEYPSLADLADALYWSNQGDNTKLDEYYQACAAVKAKYPKP